MSLKDRLQTILGAEDGNPEVVLVTPEEHAVVLADGEIAASEVVVAQAQEEIVQQQADIEQLEERVEDLEEDLAGLESMFSGATDWNPGLAQKLYNNARRISVRTFGEEDAVSVKGAEAFGDASTAQMELISGVEAMKERAGEMWKGVKQFFINLYNSVIAFFTGIFDRLRGLEKKADALITRLNAVADDKIKDTIKLGGWNVYLEVDKGDKLAGRLSAITGALNEVASGLAAQTAEGLKGAVTKGSAKFVAALDDKKQKVSTDNTETLTAKAGGVVFTVVLPKAGAKDDVAALKGATVSYSTSKEGVKTEGEFKSGKGKGALIELAKKTKSEATAARIAKFDASALKTARDKAIAQTEAAGGEKDDVKKKVGAIRAGNGAALKFARVLTSFQADAIAAQQSFIAAHV